MVWPFRATVYKVTKLKDLSSRSVCAQRKPNFYKTKELSKVFLVFFLLLSVILRHKLDKHIIFTTQLRHSLFKCRLGYRITILKDLSSRSVCAKGKPNLYERKQYSIVFLVLFSLL